MRTVSRRRLLAGSAAAASAALAGCGFILGNEPLRLEAQAARVQPSVAQNGGYDHDGTTDQTIERTVEAAGQSREIVVTNRVAKYSKAVDLGPIGEVRAAFFTALSTPQVSILGETLNPVAHLSTEDLVRQLQERFEDVGSLEPAGESPVTVLGTETTQTRFAGEMQIAAGERIDVFLHLSEPVEHEGDLLIGLGGYPQQLPAEEPTLIALMEGLEHPAD
jgi:hypothetical protein